MSNIEKIHAAKRDPKDEFYTQLSDIENECYHYRKHFKGKSIYCNCDDPRVSNFFKYFFDNFKYLGLRKLIATCYKNQSPDLFSRHDTEKSVCLEYTGGGEGRISDPAKVEVKELEGDGDFRSPECVEFLKQSDIVATNPPFSLFQEYVAQLMKYEKKFLIIGRQTAITYKEIFPFIKAGKMWLGYGFKGGAGHFMSNYEDYATATDRKEGMIRVSGVHWFTNLEHSKRNKKLRLYKKYSPDEYLKYDNYDAIEVCPVKNIPKDYDGAMGVPVSFLNKYNPDQFEIIGTLESSGKGFSSGLWEASSGVSQPLLKGERKFLRLFVRNKLIES